MLANPAKFQFLIVGDRSQSNINILVDGITIQNSKTVKLLGVTIDSQLNFLPQAELMSQTVNRRTNALNRIRDGLNTEKANRLGNSFISILITLSPNLNVL